MLLTAVTWNCFQNIAKKAEVKYKHIPAETEFHKIETYYMYNFTCILRTQNRCMRMLTRIRNDEFLQIKETEKIYSDTNQRKWLSGWDISSKSVREIMQRQTVNYSNSTKFISEEKLRLSDSWKVPLNLHQFHIFCGLLFYVAFKLFKFSEEKKISKKVTSYFLSTTMKIWIIAVTFLKTVQLLNAFASRILYCKKNR